MMVESRTAGFDIVIQLLGKAIEDKLEDHFSRLSFLEKDITITTGSTIFAISLNFRIEKPTIQLDLSGPGENPYSINIPFSNLEMSISSPTHRVSTQQLEGKLWMTHGFTFAKEDNKEKGKGKRTLKIDFANRAPEVLSLEFSDSSIQNINDSISQFKQMLDQNLSDLNYGRIRHEIEKRIRDYLVNEIRERILLEFDVCLNSDDPNVMKDADFKSVNEGYGRSGLTFLITLGGSRRGDLGSFNKYLIGSNAHTAGVFISNRYLLEGHLIPFIEQIIGRPNGFQRNNPSLYALKDPVIIASALKVQIKVGVSTEHYIYVDALVRDNSIRGLDAGCRAILRIRFKLENVGGKSEIKIQPDIDVLYAYADIEPWVYVLLFFGAFPLFVATVIVDRGIDIFLTKLLRDVATQTEKELSSLFQKSMVTPYGSLGNAFLIKHLELDDLVLLGEPLILVHLDVSLKDFLERMNSSWPAFIRSMARDVNLSPPFRLSEFVRKLDQVGKLS
jgi:hypothetical protein